MRLTPARWSLAFSCLGHTYMHLFAAFYFTVVLALEDAWALPYDELLQLWTPAALLVGVAALPAGWLMGRVGAIPLIVAMFLGMGIMSLAAAASGSPFLLMLGLAGIGLFAAIYHPVGIPWVIRTAERGAGRALAINGIFGSIGVAGGALVAGLLIDLGGWRTAFLVPGVVSVATGIVMWVMAARGRLVEATPQSPRAEAQQGRDERIRVFVILLFTMLMSGVIFHAMQTATPKLFDLRLADLLGDGKLGVGLAVGAVYLFAGVGQVVGGVLSDRLPLKSVYLATWLFQVPLFLLAAQAGGFGLILLIVMTATFTASALPAENLLLAACAPEKRHGLAFGLKFVLAFGAAPVALLFVAYVENLTGEFVWLLAAVGAMAASVLLAIVFLPTPRRLPAAVAVPAE